MGVLWDCFWLLSFYQLNSITACKCPGKLSEHHEHFISCFKAEKLLRSSSQHSSTTYDSWVAHCTCQLKVCNFLGNKSRILITVATRSSIWIKKKKKYSHCCVIIDIHLIVMGWKPSRNSWTPILLSCPQAFIFSMNFSLQKEHFGSCQVPKPLWYFPV